ncbi:MAG: hypothetical protein IPM83_16905 [Ignavibacteria bacterium]|nr:hypothetical protein [Ignavibacteria bacterium]
MKLMTLVLVCALCTTPSQGQKRASQPVPGTICRIEVPDGFVASSEFYGFINSNNGASIMISVIPGSYSALLKAFTPEALEAKGMKVLKTELVRVDKQDATLFSIQQFASGVKYYKQTVMFGDEQKTTIINGIYPASSPIAGEIRQSILSYHRDTAQKRSFERESSFSVNVEGTSLKYVNNISGMMIYNEDGAMPSASASLVVGSSLGKVLNIGNKKDYTVDRLKKLPNGELAQIQRVDSITIGDLKGYEVVANGVSSGGYPELVYLLMLYKDSLGYYMVIGRSLESQDKMLHTFMKVARTFKAQ